jgi:hypothetical protein
MRTIREELIQILENVNKVDHKHGMYRVEPGMVEWLKNITASIEDTNEKNSFNNETSHPVKH